MGLLSLLALAACQSTESIPQKTGGDQSESTTRSTLSAQQAINALKTAIEAYPTVDGINLKETEIPNDWSGVLVGPYLSPVQIGQWKFYPYRIEEKKVTFSLFYDFATKKIEGNKIPGVINIEFNLIEIEGLSILEFSTISHGAILQPF